MFIKLLKPNLKKADLQLHRFGQSCTIPKGYFTTRLEIDGDDFETKFYVVSDDVLKFPAMIGNDLLEDAELIVNRSTYQVESEHGIAYSNCQHDGKVGIGHWR